MKKLLKTIFPLRNYDIKSYCFLLLLLVYVLGFIGVYLIYVLDLYEKQAIKQDLYQKQIRAFVAGFAIIIVISLIDYHFIAKFYIILYFFC